MYKNFLSFFAFFLISLDAMDNFKTKGFESQAEQLFLIAQKNKEFIDQNIEYYDSLVFPTPPTAFLISLPFTFLGAALSTSTGFGPEGVGENGLFKNWGLLTKKLITLYATIPVLVVFDFSSHVYNFVQFNQNKQEYEYQYNQEIENINNNNCKIRMEILNNTSYANTLEKIKKFFFRQGAYLRGRRIWAGAIGHITKTITFNNHEENENIEDELHENDIENVLEQRLVINKKTRFTKIKFSLNETTKIGYYQQDRFHCKKFFILDTKTNNTYPFLPHETVVDVGITPGKTTLIAITPTKVIKINVTKDLNMTKTELEKKLWLKNRKEKLINLISKSIWTFLFLCYSQWWFKYFHDGDMCQETKKAGLFLKKYLPPLFFLPLQGFQHIFYSITNVKLNNVKEFLFGKL